LKKLGIIAALPAEAACLYDKKLQVHTPVEIQDGIYLCLSGIGYDAASQAAEKLLDLNVTALISWGVAGALNTRLESGDLVIANSIISDDKSNQTTANWQKELLAFFTGKTQKALNADIYSSKQVCATIEDKKMLYEKTKAIAVDMESAAITETAMNNNLDFVVIRSIADKADMAIPEAVLNYTDNLGNPEILKFVGSCLSKPGQIKELLTLAKCYKKALKTLNDIAEALKKQHFFNA
jgi:adenosylhomocysteine nucleosidase